MTGASRLSRAVVAAAAVALVLPFAAACMDSDQDGRRAGDPGSMLPGEKPPEVEAQQLSDIPPGKQLPLRKGEERMTLTMPESYTPSAPYGTGTDDYRCFLLDPHLSKKVFLTGTSVQPGNPGVVHHVILFSVPPDKVDDAQGLDDATPGEGWTCFGGSGLLDDDFGLDSAPWLGAWAPGSRESVDSPGYGVPLPAGSQIVMQVHYNLLAGAGPDRSAALLRLAPPSARLTPIETMLLPAPVELPCRRGHRDNPLCNRTASIADVVQRFGPVGQTDNWLNVLCGEQRNTEVTTCTRTIQEPTTIRAVAGHMHLLGRSIKVQVDPGTPRARTILDIKVWDFDNQVARQIKPVSLQPGDTVKVTCRHVQWLRDQLPAFHGQPDRYVVWGEGTTDEMCLGILAVTHP